LEQADLHLCLVILLLKVNLEVILSLEHIPHLAEVLLDHGDLMLEKLENQEVLAVVHLVLLPDNHKEEKQPKVVLLVAVLLMEILVIETAIILLEHTLVLILAVVAAVLTPTIQLMEESVVMASPTWV
jgi:hypothetical protein